VKKYILFDHDGVLVDTELWYYRAGERALADIGVAPYVRMAIVTTAKRADFDLIHENRQIRQFMDFVLVREDYQCAKPHPEPYLTGLKRFDASREETLVVEDSTRGLSSAVAACIESAVVHSDFTREDDFSAASYRIEALIELKDIILTVV
jgi:beta-phosphoglucomutase-like phosphatase (HAD superfamily)